MSSNDGRFAHKETSDVTDGARTKLAAELERLCCAETEGKFFDCVTDNIQTVLTALRARQPSNIAERSGTNLALTAQAVPFSSVVGSSVVFANVSGAVVIQLAVMVPNPQFDYREHAEPFVKRLVALWNGGAA